MNRSGIGTRLVMLTAVLLAVAAAVGLIGLAGMAAGKQRLETVYEDRTVALVNLAGALADTLAIRRQIDLAAAAATPRQMAGALDAAMQLDAERDRQWQRYRQTRMTAEELRLAGIAEEHRVRLAQARNQVIQAFRDGGSQAGLAAAELNSVDQLYDEFHADMRRLIDLQARVAGEQYAQAAHAYALTVDWTAALMLLAVMVGTAASMRLIRSIAIPLRAAKDAADRIAAEDFAQDVPRNGIGEVGQLMGALARMQENLRAMSAKVRAQVAQLEEMSNGLPVAVYQMRLFPDGRRSYAFVSQRAADILGVAAGELMRDAEQRWRHVYPEDRETGSEAVMSLIRRARAGEKDACGEASVRMNLGGETRMVRAVAYAACPLPDGTVTLNGYYQDITEERRSQRLMRGMLDESPSVVFVKDTAGRYVLTNRAFDQQLGLPVGGALGKTDFDLFSREIAGRVRAIDEHVMGTAEVQQFEEEMPAPGGTRVFLSVKFPLVDEFGKPDALCGIANDITERRAAEMRLRDSEAYNKVLFDESHVPNIVVDPASGQYLDCNRAAVEIHGYTSMSDIVGRTIGDLSAPLQADGIDLATALRQRETARLTTLSEVFEWRYQRPGGEIWDAIVHKTAFRHDDRQLLQATLEDITLRKRAEAAIVSARQAAEESARVKADFLATMSHEIRTPLTAILGNLELLGRSPLTALQQDRLQTITGSSRTLLHIIDDILDFSKIESGQLRLERIPFDLVDTIEQIAAIFAPVARSKGLALYLSIAPDVARSHRGDPARIRQVIVNLVSNAIKFTDSGCVTIDVRGGEDLPEPSLLTISVRDTGIGIPDTIQRELFEPFRQADSSVTRRFGGSGLGLALCKRLAELMSGTVTLTSKVGAGSTFVVRISLRVDPDGRMGGWHCPDGSVIALAGGSPEWRAAIIAHLTAWGLAVIPAGRREQLPPSPAPLMVLCPTPPWCAAEVADVPTRPVITVDDAGPRTPIATGNRVAVSSYSLDGLRSAVGGTIQGCPPQRTLAGVHGELAGVPAESRTLRVLVAEDHPANRALIADQLELLGHKADFAENGSVALEMFATRPYDIVLTDLSMPVLDGYALASRLREQGTSVPVVAVTAHTMASELARCAATGMNDVLLKPFSLDDMSAMLQKHTRERIPDPTTDSSKPAPPPGRPLPPAFFDALGSTSRQSLATIKAALEKSDATTVMVELHSIKGAFLIARRADVGDECGRLEALARSNDLASIVKGWEAFERMVIEGLQADAPSPSR